METKEKFNTKKFLIILGIILLILLVVGGSIYYVMYLKQAKTEEENSKDTVEVIEIEDNEDNKEDYFLKIVDIQNVKIEENKKAIEKNGPDWDVELACFQENVWPYTYNNNEFNYSLTFNDKWRGLCWRNCIWKDLNTPGITFFYLPSTSENDLIEVFYIEPNNNDFVPETGILNEKEMWEKNGLIIIGEKDNRTYLYKPKGEIPEDWIKYRNFSSSDIEEVIKTF